MSNYSELFFLGRSQTSSGIELEENYISIFDDVISTLLSVLACRPALPVCHMLAEY